MNRSIIAMCTLLLLTSNAFGKTYKCKDAEGNIVFSDSACGTVEREEIKDRSGPSSATLEKRAIKGCLSHWKQKRPYLSNSDIRIEGYRFQWVTVKKAGARRMLYLDISIKDESAPPFMDIRAPQQLQCLMLGDGVSVNTYEYELEP